MILRYILMFLILAVAGSIDYVVIVLRKKGLASGETFSWQTYMDARNYPAIGFFGGYIACLLTSGPASEATAGLSARNATGSLARSVAGPRASHSPRARERTSAPASIPRKEPRAIHGAGVVDDMVRARELRW